MTVESIVEAVRASPNALPVGGRTKPGMLPANVETIACGGLSGIIEYEPSEYTFTAYAGTSLLEIEAALREHGQYLPFEPPLVDAGATLGGMIASGLNGPGTFRFGGIRDFILGVRFLTRDGRLLRTGGKVVKNAAGFDVSKFLVGSQGQWGTIVEATFKVFPQPPWSRSVRISFPSIDEAVSQVCQWTREPWEFDAIEIATDPIEVNLRLRGDEVSLTDRVGRFKGACLFESVVLEDDVADAYWKASREFTWSAPDETLVKVPTHPMNIPLLESDWHGAGKRRHGVGGHVAWVSGVTEISSPFVVVRGDLDSAWPELPQMSEELSAAFGKVRTFG